MTLIENQFSLISVPWKSASLCSLEIKIIQMKKRQHCACFREFEFWRLSPKIDSLCCWDKKIASSTLWRKYGNVNAKDWRWKLQKQKVQILDILAVGLLNRIVANEPYTGVLWTERATPMALRSDFKETFSAPRGAGVLFPPKIMSAVDSPWGRNSYVSIFIICTSVDIWISILK